MKRDEVPDLLLEQLALEELPAERAREVRDALGESMPSRLDALARSNREVLGELSPDAVAREVMRRHTALTSARRRRTKRTVMLTVPTLAAAAVALLWVMERPRTDLDQPTRDLTAPRIERPQSTTPAIESTRSKGLAPHLTIARKRGVEVEQLEDGAAAKPGDVLQLGYVAAGKGHGVILSIDGRGVVTLHHPGKALGSTELQDVGEVALDFAYELDDAPEFERFIFVTFEANPGTPNSATATTIVDAAQRLAVDAPARARAPLSLPEHCEQSSFLLRKSAP